MRGPRTTKFIRLFPAPPGDNQRGAGPMRNRLLAPLWPPVRSTASGTSTTTVPLNRNATDGDSAGAISVFEGSSRAGAGDCNSKAAKRCPTPYASGRLWTRPVGWRSSVRRVLWLRSSARPGCSPPNAIRDRLRDVARRKRAHGPVFPRNFPPRFDPRHPGGQPAALHTRGPPTFCGGPSWSCSPVRAASEAHRCVETNCR